MGACCTAREKDREADLPAPEITGNVFQKFEKSLPFARTYVDTFAKRVRAAAESLKEQGNGDGTFVTIEALRQKFRTAAWADLKKDDSRITKLLKHVVFADEEGNISVDKLILFAVLNSAGNPLNRSEVLYYILQEGGVEKQKNISANDKDILPAVSTMIKFATTELLLLIQDIDGDHPMDLEDKADEIEYSIEGICDTNYKDPLWEDDSRLSYEEWRDRSMRVKAIYTVWYEPQNLRMLVFNINEIESSAADMKVFEEIAHENNVNLEK